MTKKIAKNIEAEVAIVPAKEETIPTDIKAAEFIKRMNSKDSASLDKVALDKGYRTYTYRQMFRRWERYASVFSALGITENNHSRVGLICGKSEEALSIMYSLNMMGVSISLLDIILIGSDRLFKKTIEAEKITDIVVLDETLLPTVVDVIKKNVHNPHLRHVIVAKTKFARDLEDQEMRMMMDFMRKRLLAIKGIYYLQDLLTKYEAYPIQYGSGKNDEAAFIVHTSGTTKGVSKPVPLSDKALNSAALSVTKVEGYKRLVGETVTINIFTPSVAYSLADTIHFSFVSGGKMVITSFMDKRKYDVIKKYDVNILLFYYGIINQAKPLLNEIDNQYFSSLKLLVLGGEYVSTNMAKALRKVLKPLGFKGTIINGYGLTECAGAVLLNDKVEKSEGMNTALPGTEILIYDEENKEYVDAYKKPCRGGLYIHSNALSHGKIGNDEYFKLVNINGKEYYCSYDAFESDGEGNLRFIGRMNRYFVNNEGIRFDPTLIENEMAKKKGVEACTLAPTYSKVIHDTIPVLYIQNKNINEIDIRHYLKDIFIKNNLFEKTNLPSYVVLVDKIPRGKTGKADVYKIVSEGLDGRRYIVEPIKKNDKLVDILFKIPIRRGPYADNILNVPDEISKNFKDQVEGMKALDRSPDQKQDDRNQNSKKSKSSENFDWFKMLSNKDETKAAIELMYEFLLLQINDFYKSDSYDFVPYLLKSERTKKMMDMLGLSSND